VLEKKNKKIVKKRKECWSVEHSIVGSEVAATFTIIFEM
jgi:hypothetical protein